MVFGGDVEPSSDIGIPELPREVLRLPTGDNRRNEVLVSVVVCIRVLRLVVCFRVGLRLRGFVLRNLF